MYEKVFSSKDVKRVASVYDENSEREFSQNKFECAIHVFAYKVPLLKAKREIPIILKKRHELV